MTGLHGALAHFAQATPDAPALLGPGGGSYAQVWADMRAVAAQLQLLAGRVVALELPDGPLLATMLAGTVLSGALAFPLPASAPEAERERLLEGLDVALRLGPDEAEALLDHPDAASLAPARYPGPDALVLLVATSGSTGAPKRVSYRYEGSWHNALLHAESVGLPDGCRTLVVGSLAHAFPLVAQLFATWLVGGAVGFLRGPFTPRAVLKQCAEHAIDYLALPPTLLQLLVARAPQDAALPGVLSVGAGPILPEALRAAHAWAKARGARLYHTYGLSEAGPRVSTLDPEAIETGAHTVGKLLPGVEARLGANGELQLHSGTLMAGYYPEGGGLLPDGWLATGDRAVLEPDGSLALVGRLKDVIVSGGTTIGAGEIEMALKRCPGVHDAAVVAVPDADYGEAPVAFIESPAPLDEAALFARLGEQLARAKWPRRLVFRAALPRTSLGKVDKGRLRAEAASAPAETGASISNASVVPAPAASEPAPPNPLAPKE